MFVATLPRTIPLLLITVAMLGECSPIHPVRNKRNINMVMAVEGTGIPKGPWIQFLIGTSIYFGVTALLFIVTCCCFSVQKPVKQSPGQPAAVSSVPGKPKPATRKIEKPQPQKQQLPSKTSDLPSSMISGQPMLPQLQAGKPKPSGETSGEQPARIQTIIKIEGSEKKQKSSRRSGSKKTPRGHGKSKSDRAVRPPSVHQPRSGHTARSGSSSSGSSSYSTGSSYSSSGSESGSESSSGSSSYSGSYSGSSGSESSSGSSSYSGSYSGSRTSSRGSRSGRSRSSSTVSRGSSSRGSRSSHSRSSRSHSSRSRR